MPDIQKATVKELAHKIKVDAKKPEERTPRFAFFLGAGASAQSGIPTASWMISDFKRRIVEACCPDKCKTDAEKEAWLTSQSWYQPDKLYACLFEQFEPKEIGRQRYIERLIEGRKPSFGYVILANLMATNHVNAVITTNFDDLIYSACTTFTDIRPIVFAYGVLASEMRVTAKRPKILKLHGDFLYSAIKNTDVETRAQDPNMARQVSQVLGEYGLIVAGYSGGDESVMDIFAGISEKNDLYWCVHRGNEPNDRVQKLLRDKRGFLVEMDGFDEMMDEVRGIVGFDVRAMLGSVQSREEEMIEQLKSFAPRAKMASILSEIATALEEQTTQQQTRAKKHRALTHFVQALDATDEGKPSDAEEHYRKAIELDPNDAAAHYNLGWLLAKDAVRAADAEAEYRKAIELDPNDAAAHNNLGLLLAQDAARAADAEAAYRKAIELGGLPDGGARAHNNLGSLLAKDATRAGDAEAEYRKAIELDPSLAQAHYNLGNLLAGDPARAADAEAEYRKAIELDPNDDTAHSNLGILLAKDPARAADAEAEYRKAIELAPNAAVAHNNLGNLLAKDATRAAEAEAAYREAIHLDPNDATAHNNLGNLLAGDPARAADAEAEYRKAIELDPNDAAAHYNLGALLAKDPARAADAEAEYRKAIELDPNDAAANAALAYFLRTHNRFDEAEPFYRRAVELEPNNPRRYFGLTLLLRQQAGREAEAIPLLEKILQLDSQDADALLALVSVHKKLGHAEESAKFAAQARALIKPEDWYDLACLESVCGNPDAAIENLRRAAQSEKFDRAWAKRDPDLEWIRDDPRFKEIVGM